MNANRSNSDGSWSIDGDLEKPPSWQFFKTRSENVVSTSLHFLSTYALEKWRGIFASHGHLEVFGSAQYVVIVQYPIEEEKGSVGSSSLHVKYCQFFKVP